MHTTIIPMTNQHIETVLALWQTIPGIGLSSADTPVGLTQFFNRNPNLSFVAYHTNQLIGAALCGHDGRRGYLHHVAVMESYRGQGIGSMLVDHCLRALKAQAITKCHLFVFADNHHGQTFWKQCGWIYRDDLLIYSLPLNEGNR